jgi:hypothetical protein
MRALSILQPWAWLICEGYKPIENRSWYSSYRGPFAIHAGKRWGLEQAHDLESIARAFPHIPLPNAREFERGGVVGTAVMTDCVSESRSEWFCGRYGFVFADAEPHLFVPWRGMLSWFDIPDQIFVPRNTPHIRRPQTYALALVSVDNTFLCTEQGMWIRCNAEAAIRVPTFLLAERWRCALAAQGVASMVSPCELSPSPEFMGDVACVCCGCTTSRACPDQCHWVIPSICSSCIPSMDPESEADNLWLSAR